MKRKGLIATGILVILVLIVAGVGFYKFNYTDNDVYYEGKNIQPENKKLFFGAWIEESPQGVNEQAMGFVLNPDSTALSINSATLVYKKWKIVNDQLVLTSISLGNRQLSIDDDAYQIISYNHKKFFIKRDTQKICYSKTTRQADKMVLPEVTFEYCPVNVEDINAIATTHIGINWKSNPRANKFRKVISSSYTKGKANFGGYYQIITWGCGSGCQEGVMIDTRDGTIYNLPTVKGYQDIGSGANHKFESILLVTYTTLHNPKTDKVELDNRYWLWNENSKEFVRYK